MRSAVRTMLVVCGIVLGLAPPALADGPGRRHADGRHARRLGDLRRGRALGRQHERLVLEASTRSARPPTGTRRPARRSRAATARRRRRRTSAAASPSVEPRLLGREDVDRRHRLGEDFKPGIDFYSDASGPPGPGADAPELRGDAQRQGRRRDDRRQQLRLRRHRRALRDELADVAVVVEELLQRRLGHDLALHRRAPGDRRRRTSRTRCCACAQAMTNAGYADSQYTIIAQTYWSPIPRGSGFRYPRERLDAPVGRRLRHLEPRRRLGQRHRRRR